MLDSPVEAARLEGDAPPLVGPEREQALLGTQLAAALGGRGGLALVGGEAGIGKTALIVLSTRLAPETPAGRPAVTGHTLAGSTRS